MRVLSLFPSLYEVGGPQVAHLAWFEEFPALGMELEAITWEPSGPLLMDFREHQKRIRFIPYRLWDSPQQFIGKLAAVVRLAAPDVIVSHDLYYGYQMAVVLEKELPATAFVHVIHNDFPAGDQIYSQLAPLVNHYQKFVCVNGQIRSCWEKFFSSGNLASLQVIQYGIPSPPEASGVISTKVRGQGMRLVTVGRLENQQKRVLEIPHLAAALRSAGINFTWTILGDGSDRTNLDGLVSRLRLQDQVILAGAVERRKVHDVLASSDMLVMPSAFEGLPIAALEAMSHRCIVVCAEEIRPCFAGNGVDSPVQFFDVEHPEVFALLVKSMSVDFHGTMALAEQTRRYFEENFSVRRMARRYQQVFQSAIRERSGPVIFPPSARLNILPRWPNVPRIFRPAVRKMVSIFGK